MSAIVDQARDRVRQTGARVTAARIRVLAVLMQAGEALSHTELQRRLEHDAAHEALDRVTLYRVLDWLVEVGLAHRVSGADRVWRFSALGAGRPAHGRHGHFTCRVCERTFCMKEAQGLVRTARTMLPEGFSADTVELTVLGRCADCVAAGATLAAAGRPAGRA